MSEQPRLTLVSGGLPAAEQPLLKLSAKTEGFRYTVAWKPGFDDPRMERAQGTESIVFDVDIKYDRPASWPMQAFLALRKPHEYAGWLPLVFEDTGRSVSALLRHGWTPPQLAAYYPEGTLSRALALFLCRCPRADWSDAP